MNSSYPLPGLRFQGEINVVVRFLGGQTWTSSSGSPASSTIGGTSQSASDSKTSHFETPPEQAHIEIVASNIKVQFNELRPGTQYVRRLVVSVGEVQVYDRVPTSDVNVLLCYDRERPREPGSGMFALHMEVSWSTFLIVIDLPTLN